MPRVTLNIEPCTTIDAAAKEAQGIADLARVEVAFEFNSVMCVAVPDGDADLLAARQNEEQTRARYVFSAEGRC